jgi:hypothetical protein
VAVTDDIDPAESMEATMTWTARDRYVPEIGIVYMDWAS